LIKAKKIRDQKLNLTSEYLNALIWINLNKNETKVLLFILTKTWCEEKEMINLSQIDIAAGANVYISKVADALSLLAGHKIIEWDSEKGIIKPLLPNEWTKKLSQPKEVGIREQEIFDFWNEMDIMKHKDIGRYHPHIKAALNKYSISELKKAIQNYAIILKSPDEYRWDWTWPLDHFLTRGLERFLDIAKPLENFRKKKTPEEKALFEDL